MKAKKIHKKTLKALDYAYEKHGKKLWGRHEFFGILQEEFDEVWDEIKADAPQANLKKEILQIIAVCYRYLNTGDRYRERYE